MARLQAERQRLADADRGVARWRRWGPYLAERAWGTVREDYGADGDPWSYFPHEHARSRAYRWNEDGLAGFCDEAQTLCLAVALWNERDPILKERMFGLSNRQGNHGEDAKEYWFFLDGTPTHSYMKMRYLYPQVAYPYDELVRANAARDASLPEVELLDVLRDAFAERRYFDVLVEYAKAGPEDLLCRIRAVNRGPDPAPIHVLPHLWYRNTWAWKVGAEAPAIEAAGQGAARTRHPAIGERFWYVRAPDGREVELFFTGNETNLERLYGVPNAVPQVKDGIHDRVVGGKVNAVNAERGSKAAAHISATVAPGATFEVQVRLAELEQRSPFTGFDATFDRRIAEADDFYAGIHPEGLTAEERRVQRLAFAGLLWSKQYYAYDVYRWLEGDPTQPPPPDVRRKGRNHRWKELSNADVLLMPDTWEYPWYAAWDLAFHCVTMAHVDPRTAKDQLLLLGRERYQHASGQYPAYEWNLDDVNPPLEGWAALQVYRIEAQATGRGDVAFLREAFQSAMLSFSFWVNRKDAAGRDVFGGGFLGMDNIGVFDRDRPVPGGGELEQSDGTGWMARFAMTMLEIAVELAEHDPVYESAAARYFEHFLSIAHAMTDMGGEGVCLWDDVDAFYYDVVHFPDGRNLPLRVRSMVGVVPLLSVGVESMERIARLTRFASRANGLLEKRPDLACDVAPWDVHGHDETALFAILHGERLRAVLRRVLDPDEFLSPHGVRSLSRHHADHPFAIDVEGDHRVVRYTPGESGDRLFGGNSNWRGPVWFPMNYLLIRALRTYARFYGESFQVEFPTGSGDLRSLSDVADRLTDRLVSIFLPDAANGGRRPVWGEEPQYEADPAWRDLVPFHEYFHGDTAAGLGASHQTGWTALVAALLFDRKGGRVP